ncbi:MAG: hypothetical protein IPN85_17775 [Flavobacteriales bacterium]|nr:hypothetical protein [Flavobacteriales bacterium]MBK9286791.1 hypothetical protein [Flavobacteriales bacterium]MBL0035279.1 hypothetical protein [Flavobacteriales bacterium]
MRWILIPIGLMAALSVSAQALLNRNALPATGSVYGYHDTPYLSPGRAGDGLQWDFADLPSGTLIPYAWTTTDIAPGAGAFPHAARVLDVIGQPAQYFQATDTALLWLGWYSDTTLLRFDPPLRILHLPCAFQSAWGDTGVAAITGSGRVAVLRVEFHTMADARGTLNMPYGSIRDVLRLRSELKVYDPAHPDHALIREVRNAWYTDQTPMPLLVTTERPTDELTGRSTKRTLRWLDGSWRDGPENLFRPLKLRVYPDPCDDNFWIVLPERNADHTLLQLIDETGMVSKQWNVEFNSSQSRTINYDVSDLASGHYTVVWVGTNGTIGNARLEIQ